MKTEHHTLTKIWVVAALASLCCILWGSAIPMIKTGYRLLQVDTTNTANQIVFAGIRFALAGLFVLIFASIQEKKVTLPDVPKVKGYTNLGWTTVKGETEPEYSTFGFSPSLPRLVVINTTPLAARAP